MPLSSTMDIVYMQSDELSIGIKYTVPQNTYMVFKEKGESTQFNMLIKGSFNTIYSKLKHYNPMSGYLLLKMIDNVIPKSGSETTFHAQSYSEELSLSKSNVYKLLALLMQADLVRKIKKGHYFIDPSIVWNGKTADRVDAVQKWSNIC